LFWESFSRMHGDHIICYVLISRDIYPIGRIICGSCIFPYFHSKNTLSLSFSTFPNKNGSKEIDHAKYFQQKNNFSNTFFFYNMYWLLLGLTGTYWGGEINTFYWNNSLFFFHSLILDLSRLKFIIYFSLFFIRLSQLNIWVKSLSCWTELNQVFFSSFLIDFFSMTSFIIELIENWVS